MSDIAKRLRLYGTTDRPEVPDTDSFSLLYEAADEIERQQYAMKRAIVALRKHGSIAYAIRQLESELPEEVDEP